MINQDLLETQTPSQSTLTPTPTTPAQQTEHLLWTIVQAADDRKAADITILKVNEISYLSDYFVIVTGFSRTQVKAIADAIETKVAEECEQLPLRTEGKAESSWIVQDYGDIIVHIFLPQEREFYHLEAFWGHAQRIEFSQLNPVESSL